MAESMLVGGSVVLMNFLFSRYGAFMAIPVALLFTTKILEQSLLTVMLGSGVFLMLLFLALISFPQDVFRKNSMSAAFINRVARVLVGTLGAQLITIGVTLLLVRLYSPAEMGAFSVWLSFATIFAVVVTGRYELAIFSTREEGELRQSSS